MEEKIMISKDISLVRDGVWVNGINITSSEDWDKVVEESIPKQKIRLELEKVTKEIKEVEKKHLKARTIQNQELWRCVLIRLDERIKVYEELLK